MNVVDPYDTNTPQDPADTSSGLAQLEYFPAHPYSHPDFDSFGDHDGLAFFSDGTVNYWGEDVGVGKTSLMGHDHPLGLGDPGTELDLPLSDHSYPASSSASTGSPASTNVVCPPGYTPDDGQWQQRHQRDGPGDLLPPLQLAYPVMSMNTPRTSSPHRRALNMPYHELSPRATPMMPGSSSSYFTPKASGAVRAYPLVFSHTDIESPSHQGHQHPHPHMQQHQQQSPGQYQHRCVPLSELTAAYIPNTVSRNGAVEPLRTSSLGALSVQSEGVQPARLVTQPQQHHQLLKRPHSPYSPSLPSTPSDESFGFPSPKRARVTSMRLPEPRADGYSDAEGESEAEFDDEDAYLPSRSPSPAFSGSNYSDSGSPVRNYRSRNTRRAKGKVAAMMSAADALRYAQQASSGSASRSASNGYESDVISEVKPRKNQAIPIPIPIPHLTKKSRGRKVPYVDAQVSRIRSRGGSDEEEVEIRPVRGTTSRRGRGGRSGGGRSGERSFICSVPGCGKCFVRGEHLKRHVRSIHTHEKPYPCPYEGCQKSFSRRDNLGQHVRLHLIAA